MPSTRRPFALLLAVPALLVGCSAGPAASSAPPPPAITANPTPVSTEVTSAPPATSPAAVACPSGDYKATGFSAVGANSATGKGTVKDVDVTFRNGRYTFEFDDDDPITLTPAPPSPARQRSGRKNYRDLYNTRRSWLITGRTPTTSRRPVPLDVLIAGAE